MAALHKDTFTFLKGLKKNNDKIWFDAHREQYDNIREGVIGVVSDVLKELSKTDSALAELDAKKCLFRINRDVRFSKNKNPYKTNFGASISRGGKKSPSAGYYIHIEPGATFVGGGCWQPEPPQLAKIRQEIDYNYAEYQKLIKNKKFVETYETMADEDKLVTVPKGYKVDNPAIEVLKQRSFIYGCDIPDAEVLSDKFARNVAGYLKVLSPYIDFINRSFE